MRNFEIARVFEDIADLLELKGELPFKVRAYQRAARVIERLPLELAQVAQEGKLRDIPGVGEALAKKITELLATGRLDYYERLRAEFPEGMSALMEVPGIGPKTALRLAKELNVSTVEELEHAIEEGRVADLFRMGDRTAENILRHLQSLRRKDMHIPIGVALPIVEEMLEALRRCCPGVHNLTPAGSLRRFKETIGDIDLMGTADDPEAVLKTFVELPQVEEVLAQGSTKASVLVHGGLQVDLRLVEHDRFGSLLQYFTGSKDHNIALRERGVRQGLKLSEYGITSLETGATERFASEEDFYRRLGLPYIPPELRQGGPEIERAEKGTLPGLVETHHLKGDLHVHTDWSDGHESIESMALAAQALGYQYIAIADHSVGRGIAHGLSPKRLWEQVAEIRRVDQGLESLRIFAGTELDIRADGTLDFPDELLEELDFVIAAVHSAMGQDEEKMTRRVLRAMGNPHVHAIAHLTCRLLGEREPVTIDMEKVFRAAVETDTALEINAMPARLDLKDTHVFRARELGVKLLIGTDAHSSEQLDLMRFGVGVARRGWCEPHHILNTRPLAEIEAFVRRPLLAKR